MHKHAAANVAQRNRLNGKQIGFWLQHFAGMQLRDITESKIYSAMQKMTNRRHEENWKTGAVHSGQKHAEKKGNLFQNTRQNQRPLQRRLRIFHL